MKHVHLLPLLLFPSLACSQPGAASGLPAPVPAPAEVERRVDTLLQRMTLDEKIEMIGGYQGFNIQPSERLGIPKIVMADGPLGVRNYGEATAFPAGIALAASWNTQLMGEIGKAVGDEARAKGVHIMLAPAVNIYRAPLCGRNFEYFGEDPYLASRMAVAYITGLQSRGVCATVKHFAANNQEYDRHNVSSDLDERTLQEIYLPAFRAAVEEAHVGAVMTAYNPLNGVHCSQNNHLIKEILKGQWKFDGFVMSDWGSTYDGVAAANAGLDLEMPSAEFMNPKALLPALQKGTLTLPTIDDKIRRMLRVMFRFGFFDRPQQDTTLPLYNPSSRLVALQAAREGIVLLKNNHHLLPLDVKNIKSIAVIGPNAHPAVTGGGGSSRVGPFRAVSALEGITQECGGEVQVFYAQGITPMVEALFERAEFHSGPNGTKGLRGEYFDNMQLEGAPVFTRIDPQVNFQWSHGPREGFRTTSYSVRWSGEIKTAEAGQYEFVVRSDDGFRLYVDDKLLVSSWQDRPATTVSHELWLGAHSTHRVKLEYYQNQGDAVIAFGWGRPEKQITPEVRKVSRLADAAIVCVGFDASTESEGADRSFALPDEQERLIREVAAINRNTIVVLTAGGNVDMSAWLDNVPALLHTWYPGQEGGTALAEILTGAVNPSARLPASFEQAWKDNACYSSYADSGRHLRYAEGIFLGYRHFDRTGITPRFPFGFGLSYTTFAYSNIRVEQKKVSPAEHIVVECDLANAGIREGAEVVQLYIHAVDASIPRPVKELKAFEKVFLKAGATTTVRFTLDARALSLFDPGKNTWLPQPGSYEVLIGSSSQDIRLKESFMLHSP